jgi:hypothetical protein
MARLTISDENKFLRERLEEQRHLLEKSIHGMASGDLSEGLRIATSIRVLVHETASSKPLLKQLTGNYLELEILDELPKKEETLPPGTTAVVIMSVPISVNIADKGVFLNPELAVDAHQPTILGRWWTRSSLILPGIGGLSRKEVILGLANKEGGAHVDTDISQKYQQLLASKSLQMGTGTEVTPLNLSRLMAGQSGVELLDCLKRNFPPE